MPHPAFGAHPRCLGFGSCLIQVDRAVTPFVVVSAHCPFYSTNKNHYQEWQALAMQETFEPLYMDGGVDVVRGFRVLMGVRPLAAVRRVKTSSC